MWKKVASVGSLTLVSRLFGFLRDILMAAMLGAGPLADAFMVAFRLPNHFRAIFAEGAFNAAFVPRYANTLAISGAGEARQFASGILGWTLFVHGFLLVVVMLATPQFVSLLAPGFRDDPEQLARTVELTRITFPYLLLISVMTLAAGMLNAHDRFAVPAAAPIFLNLCLIAALIASPYFPDTAVALAWGVLAAGFAQLLFVLWDLYRARISLGITRPRIDAGNRDFLKGFAPAVVGSAGQQMAMLADTFIASFLPAGSIAYLYYADRLYQLPVAIIGIAIGTVLLPDLSRRFAAGDRTGAANRFNRALEGCVVLGLPFVALFALEAVAIMHLLFGRGAFDEHAAQGAGLALSSYAVGLLPILLLRPVVAAFHARKDTTTPVIAFAISAAINIMLKVLLISSLQHAGLALATAIGAWINFLILYGVLLRKGEAVMDQRLLRMSCVAVAAALMMAAVLIGLKPFTRGLPDIMPHARGLLSLSARSALALIAYAAMAFLGWKLLRRSLKPLA